MGLVGDMDGDALFDLPNGIDAISFEPSPVGTPPRIHDLLFSMDRDTLGFADGDVLRLSHSGGFEQVHTEADLLADLQVPSGNLDIDALARVSASVLFLSLRDGLSGTSIGDLEDGDVLSWDTAAGMVSVIATEAQVQTWVDHATGGTASIGDLKSLSFLPGSTEMLFTVQAPTAADATVFADGSGGRILPGWEEDDWQFQVSTELDALCFIPETMEQPVLLTTDVHYLTPDTDFQVRMRHAEVGEQLRGMTGPNFQILSSSRGGVGYTVLDPSSGPLLRWPGSGFPPLLADASGTAETKLRTPILPAGVPSVELWYQVYAQVSGWSTPLVLRVE